MTSSDQHAEKVRVVTPQQYRDGYLVRTGGHVETMAWSLVRRLDDGNYLVRSDELVEFWVEYETGNEHYRCSVCGNIGPVPQTADEIMRREAEHLVERHSDGDER
jgi:hypothetical protein